MNEHMKGNPHYWQLTRSGYATDTPEYAATCQVEATLALAFEQRTANLIAWSRRWMETPELNRIIIKRLGLEDCNDQFS